MRYPFLQSSRVHNLSSSIKSFYYQYITREWKVVYSLVALTLLLGFIDSMVNAFTYQFPGYQYLPLRWAFLIPVVLAITLLALVAREQAPRLAFFTRSYGTYFFIVVAFAVLSTGIQYTPFNPIDVHLVAWDQWLGFNTPALLAWTASHSTIQRVLEGAYEFLNIEMLLIPLLLPLFQNETRVNRLFAALLIAFLLGTTVYYFFPTMSPVAMFHSPYFLAPEHTTYHKFYGIHHYEALTSDGGGLISFPSFHVVWAVILTAATFPKKWIFFPLVLINFIVILSTLFLGWHYLVDVFAGFALALIAIFLAYRFTVFHGIMPTGSCSN